MSTNVLHKERLRIKKAIYVYLFERDRHDFEQGKLSGEDIRNMYRSCWREFNSHWYLPNPIRNLLNTWTDEDIEEVYLGLPAELSPDLSIQ